MLGVYIKLKITFFIRDEKITIADIYKADDELYEWWMNDERTPNET